MEVETKVPAPSISSADLKLSYTIKEVCKLVGVSSATIYQVLARRELRAVKLGKKLSSWQRTRRNGWTICRRCDEHVEVWRNPSPSNCEAKLLTGLAINQTILRYPQIYPRSVSE